MIEIEGDGGGGADCREECVCASIVAGGDAPPILEFGEQVLDFVARAIERLVVIERQLAASGRRNARFEASLLQRRAEPV